VISFSQRANLVTLSVLAFHIYTFARERLLLIGFSLNFFHHFSPRLLLLYLSVFYSSCIAHLAVCTEDKAVVQVLLFRV